jgi:hypothetical protein
MAAGNIWTRLVIDSDSSLPSSQQRINAHHLQWGITLRALGNISDAAIISHFNLDADGQVDFTNLKAAYAALTGTGATLLGNQAAWREKAAACFGLVQDGVITEAQAKTALGVS